ncbi:MULTISPECIES: hypothetical protein [unclassified Microbacterium]|uniref:hypothetical protein n=1 Tax=Microbacterium sp. PF5 TaxID=2305435 RepID=UPI00109B7198|nr:hypothetical protein [Microbacterium sp. PF5]
MAAAVRLEPSTPDPELDLMRRAFQGLARDAGVVGELAIARRSTEGLCIEGSTPVVPVLLDGRGVLVGPVRRGAPGCPCCAIARRTQHGLGSGLVGPDHVLVARGRTMTAATAWLVALQALVLLQTPEDGRPALREVDPRTATVRSWRLIPDEECHCAVDH